MLHFADDVLPERARLLPVRPILRLALMFTSGCAGCSPSDDVDGATDAMDEDVNACDSSALDGGAVSDASVLVPITTYQDQQGYTRFAIVVYVNGVPVSVELDTGSSGLRVLSSAIADAGMADSGPNTTQHYNGGTYLLGYEADAILNIGGIPMSGVPMQVVTCVNTTGDASACDSDASVFGQQGIIGVGLRTSPTPTIRSPLAFIQDQPAFLVRMTGADGVLSADAGYLQLGVRAGDYDSFTGFDLTPSAYDAGANATPFWIDYSVPSCVQDLTNNGSPWCSGTLFDTGDPAPYIETTDATAFEQATGGLATPYALAFGHHVQISVNRTGGCAFDRYTIDAGSPPNNEVQIRLLSKGSSVYNNVSQHFFYRYDVLWDQKAGEIGLRARAP